MKKKDSIGSTVISNDNLKVDHTDIEIKTRGGLGFQSDTSNSGPLISEGISLTPLKGKKKTKSKKNLCSTAIASSSIPATPATVVDQAKSKKSKRKAQPIVENSEGPATISIDQQGKAKKEKKHKKKLELENNVTATINITPELSEQKKKKQKIKKNKDAAIVPVNVVNTAEVTPTETKAAKKKRKRERQIALENTLTDLSSQIAPLTVAMEQTADSSKKKKTKRKLKENEIVPFSTTTPVPTAVTAVTTPTVDELKNSKTSKQKKEKKKNWEQWNDDIKKFNSGGNRRTEEKKKKNKSKNKDKLEPISPNVINTIVASETLVNGKKKKRQKQSWIWVLPIGVADVDKFFLFVNWWSVVE